MSYPGNEATSGVQQRLKSQKEKGNKKDVHLEIPPAGTKVEYFTPSESGQDSCGRIAFDPN